MNFKELRNKYGLSLIEVSKRYNIPYRTVQNWDAGVRNCPVYVLELLEHRIIADLKNEAENGTITKE